MNDPTRSPRSGRAHALWRLDLVTVAAAAICALVTWLPARLSGLTVTVRSGSQHQHVTGVAVVVAATLAAAAALGVLRVMERLSSRALGWWTVGVLGVLVVSSLGPLNATSAAAAGLLLGLHAVVAAVVLAAAWRSRRPHLRARGQR